MSEEKKIITPSDFAIRQEIVREELHNPFAKGNHSIYPAGIDVGYSSTKGFGPNARFAFPSFAKEMTGPLLASDPGDIMIHDLDTGEKWLVGRNVLSDITADDTAGEEWYKRRRYQSREYRAVLMAALGITENFSGALPMKIQTGLPPAFVKQDSRMLRKAFSGPMNFTMKIGNGTVRKYHVDLKEDDIGVMAQPIGTLYSVITDIDGKRTPGWQLYFTENTIIFDGGFGTLDVYPIISRQTGTTYSYREYGMHEVLSRVSQSIYDKFGYDIPVNHILPKLKPGSLTIVNDETLTDQTVSLAPYIDAASQGVCKEALDKLLVICKPIGDYRHLIVTGGTGEAWYPYIQERFKNLNSLKIKLGNPEGMSTIYANARGYYYCLIDTEQQKRRNAA